MRGESYLLAQPMGAGESSEHPVGSCFWFSQHAGLCLLAIPSHFRAGTKSGLCSCVPAGCDWGGEAEEGQAGALAPGGWRGAARSEQAAPQTVASRRRVHAALVAPFDAWIRSSLGPANSNTSSEISSNWWWATSGLWNENSKTFDWVQVKWIFIICSVNFCQDEWYYDSILIISEVVSLLFSSICKEQTASTLKIYYSLWEKFCSFQMHPQHFTNWNGVLHLSLNQPKNTNLSVERWISFLKFLQCVFLHCMSMFFLVAVVISDWTWIFSFQRG